MSETPKMSDIFRAIVDELADCVCPFGGAVIDMLLKQEIKTDIDLFVRGDVEKQTAITRVARLLRFTFQVQDLEICRKPTVDYAFAMPKPTVFTFTLQEQQYHIDLIELAVNADVYMDFDVNSLYIEDRQLKSLLTKPRMLEFVPYGEKNEELERVLSQSIVNSILHNIRRQEMRQIFFPTKETDTLRSKTMFERYTKMTKKGFNLDGTKFFYSHKEKLPLATIEEICHREPRFNIESRLHDCIIIGLDAIAFKDMERIPSVCTVYYRDDSNVVDLSGTELRWNGNILEYPGGVLYHRYLSSSIQFLTDIEHLQYDFTSKKFSSLKKEVQPLAYFTPSRKLCREDLQNSPDLFYLGFSYRGHR